MRVLKDRHTGGFTLLEVMIALAILATALSLAARSQQASMRIVGRGQRAIIAASLAREFLVDYEDELLDNGFPELDKEDDGDFEDAGYSEIKYKLKIEKIELPTDIAQGNEGGAEGDDQSPTSAAFGASASAAGQYLELFRNVLEQSIRRVELTMIWKEGKKERSFDVVVYVTDPRKIEAAGANISALSGALGGASNGTGATGASTGGTQ